MGSTDLAAGAVHRSGKTAEHLGPLLQGAAAGDVHLDEQAAGQQRPGLDLLRQPAQRGAEPVRPVGFRLGRLQEAVDQSLDPLFVGGREALLLPSACSPPTRWRRTR